MGTVGEVSVHEVELDIEGMTCTSCAARIEKRLNRLDGVTASVNYVTEKAKVSLPSTVSTDELVAAVAAAGYTARIPQTAAPDGTADSHDDPSRALRQRLSISVLLALPVVALSMIPSLQFDAWQWLSFALAAPVVVWGAWPFHKATWANLRHGTATMDTLISVGTLAAFGWSVYALFFGDAGDPRGCGRGHERKDHHDVDAHRRTAGLRRRPVLRRRGRAGQARHQRPPRHG